MAELENPVTKCLRRLVAAMEEHATEMNDSLAELDTALSVLGFVGFFSRDDLIELLRYGSEDAPRPYGGIVDDWLEDRNTTTNEEDPR